MKTKNRECFVGNQKVDCPQSDRSFTASGDKLDLLPQILPWEKRDDRLFFALFLAVILGFAALELFKIKIFGKTLVEYVRPIWHFILICIAAVGWQYL